MKIQTLISALFAVILLIYGCQKTDNIVKSIFDGKIKQIVYTTDNPNGMVRYNFYYDSTALQLCKVYKNDTLQYVFSKKNENLIVVKYITGVDTTYYFAHVNSDKYIVSYNNFEEESESLLHPYRAYYSGLRLDTLLQENVLLWPSINPCTPMFYHLYTDVKCHDFVYENNNCMSIKFSYLNKLIDPCNPSKDSGKIELTYTNIDNINNQLPQQFMFLGYGDSHLLFDNYFLYIMGYSFGKPSKKLLKSIKFNFFETASNSYFYEINDKNQVNKIIANVMRGSTIINITAEIQYY
ncbi:MAG: hypothetical protein U0T77_03615 [Chitinophagales bacterium]